MGHAGSDFNNTVGEFIEANKLVGTVEILIAVGVSNSDRRESLEFTNDSNKIMYYGKTGVTTSGANKGRAIYPGDTIVLNYDSDVNVYIIAGSPSLDLKIVENLSK